MGKRVQNLEFQSPAWFDQHLQKVKYQKDSWERYAETLKPSASIMNQKKGQDTLPYLSILEHCLH